MTHGPATRLNFGLCPLSDGTDDVRHHTCTRVHVTEHSSDIAMLSIKHSPAARIAHHYSQVVKPSSFLAEIGLSD